MASVVLLAAFGADTINAFYAYRPTLGDVLGAAMPDQTRVGHVLTTVRQRVLPQHGSLVSVAIPASGRFQPRPALVWLPPAYGTHPQQQWPVVMLMAGVPGEPGDMQRSAGVAQIADRYAALHDGYAPLLVMPDQNGGTFRDTECVNGPRGDAETYLVHDVPAFMQQRFGAALDARRWAIVGFSEGGTCALTLPLRAPNVFGAFVDIGGDLHPDTVRGADRSRIVATLYGGDARQWRAHDPLWLVRRDPWRQALFAVFADGRSDVRPYRNGAFMAAALRRAGVPARFVPFPGGHNFRLVHTALTTLLPQVAKYVSMQPTSSTQT